ncbi:hypothetical protein NHP200010_05790 [Helicobacter bizzozeronii]|nr:hypothetical protein NHP200010_05790 [Helicobacter bizzozeronii]
MAGLGVGRVLGLLCFLVNVAWGVSCAYDTSYNRIDPFAQKLILILSPMRANILKQPIF